MNHYRYGATLRPFTQLNLRRLEACDAPIQGATGYRFGTMAFHRKLTDFEVSQFDLTFLGQDDGVLCSDDAMYGWEPASDERLDAQLERSRTNSEGWS